MALLKRKPTRETPLRMNNDRWDHEPIDPPGQLLTEKPTVPYRVVTPKQLQLGYLELRGMVLFERRYTVLGYIKQGVVVKEPEQQPEDRECCCE